MKQCVLFTWAIVAVGNFASSGLGADNALANALGQSILEPDEASRQHDAFVLARIPRLTLAPDAATWQGQAAWIRQRVLDDAVFRGVPPSWRQSDPDVVWTGQVETAKGYGIRKLRIEVLPGFWVPVLPYEPTKLTGKTPAILNVNGHISTGKSTDFKQLRCINLAKRGMLALNLEWIGMGQLSGPGYSHNDLARLDLCGRSGLSVFYLAMSRGLDVLVSHPHVDADRVAVTGLSGGGWQTIILSALDTRVKLAVPVAGHSALAQRVANRNSIGDLEQNPTDLVAIADYVHLNALMTPRPTLLIYNTSDDCCFVASTVKANTFDPVIPFYEQAGVKDAWQYYENSDPGTHNYERDNREQFYRFLNRHFFSGQQGLDQELPSGEEVLSGEALDVAMPGNNATFHSLAAEAAGDLPRPQNGSLPQRRQRLKDILRFTPLVASADRVGVAQEINGRQLIRYRLKIGDEWTVQPVVVEGEKAQKTAVLMADSGIVSQAQQIESMTAQQTRVIAVDPVLIGQASPAGSLAQNAMLMSTVGQRPLGVQTAQLLAVTDARGPRADDRRGGIRLGQPDGRRHPCFERPAVLFRVHAFRRTRHRGLRTDQRGCHLSRHCLRCPRTMMDADLWPKTSRAEYSVVAGFLPRKPLV